MSTTSTTSTSGAIKETVRDTITDAEDAARKSGKAALNVSGDIRADLDALRSDILRLTGQISDIVTSKGNALWSRTRSNLDGIASDAAAKGRDAVEVVRGVGDNAVDAIDQSLRKRPYTTLALAVGIGFLF